MNHLCYRSYKKLARPLRYGWTIADEHFGQHPIGLDRRTRIERRGAPAGSPASRGTTLGLLTFCLLANTFIVYNFPAVFAR